MNIDLNQLKCHSLSEEFGASTRVAKLSGWANGISILRVQDVLYIPEYGIPVCHGFVPIESINYELHLEVRLGRKPGDIPSAPHLLNSELLERSGREVCILGNIYSKNGSS